MFLIVTDQTSSICHSSAGFQCRNIDGWRSSNWKYYRINAISILGRCYKSTLWRHRSRTSNLPRVNKSGYYRFLSYMFNRVDDIIWLFFHHPRLLCNVGHSNKWSIENPFATSNFVSKKISKKAVQIIRRSRRT